MAVKKKAAGGAGALILIVVVVAIKLLGGPDLLDEVGLTSTDTSQNTHTRQTEPSRTASAPKPASSSPSTDGTYTSEDDLLDRLVRDETSDTMITLVGEVTRSLPDDNEGSRHQKFIMEMASGRTVLIAHNIDLAPRVPFREGDTVTLRGEYEWTERGGVVHWTHHDPKDWREGGWIDHDGVRYE